MTTNLSKPYLSCSEASKIMGVSRSTVQRYCDLGILKPHRTLGGHRRVSAEDVALWLKNNKSKKRRRVKKKEFRVEKFTAAYVADALLEGKLDRLDPLLDQVLLGHQYVSWLFDYFVAPAMWEIGNRWENQRIDYPDERRATSNLKHFLRTVSRSFGAAKGGLSAVGGTLEGDHSDLGSMMLELLLRESSVDAFHVGCNLPPQTLGDIAIQMNADVVWISYCHITDAEKTIADNKILRELLPSTCQLAIGGYALNQDMLSKLDYDFFGSSMQDFQQFVKVLSSEDATEQVG